MNLINLLMVDGPLERDWAEVKAQEPTGETKSRMTDGRRRNVISCPLDNINKTRQEVDVTEEPVRK